MTRNGSLEIALQLPCDCAVWVGLLCVAMRATGVLLAAVWVGSAEACAETRSAIRAAPSAQSWLDTRPASLGLLRLRGGAEDSPSDALLQATFACNKLYASVLAEASAEVAMLRKSVVSGEEVSSFGGKADAVLGDAGDKFASGTPEGDEEVSALYAAKGEDLQAALMTSLEPVFAKVLGAIKESAHMQTVEDVYMKEHKHHYRASASAA